MKLKDKVAIIMGVYGIKSTLDSHSFVPRVKSRSDPFFTCARSIMIDGTGVRCSRNPEVGWERFIPRYFPEPRRRR